MRTGAPYSSVESWNQEAWWHSEVRYKTINARLAKAGVQEAGRREKSALALFLAFPVQRVPPVSVAFKLGPWVSSSRRPRRCSAALENIQQHPVVLQSAALNTSNVDSKVYPCTLWTSQKSQSTETAPEHS